MSPGSPSRACRGQPWSTPAPASRPTSSRPPSARARWRAWTGAKAVYLQPWCDAHGLPLLASGLQVVDGHLTGRYEGRQSVGAEKARRVRSAYDLARYGRIHAYGDSREDAQMLALADRAYLRRMPAADEP